MAAKIYSVCKYEEIKLLFSTPLFCEKFWIVRERILNSYEIRNIQDECRRRMPGAIVLFWY